ncbi:hypothetical protein JCM10550A_22020 [Methanogenium cariaci]
MSAPISYIEINATNNTIIYAIDFLTFDFSMHPSLEHSENNELHIEDGIIWEIAIKE